MSDGKVLVVDDCRMSSLLLRYILGGEGVPSDAAGTGPDAVEKALAGDYDLILLDIVLPGFDGIEVARRIRRDPRVRQPRIILLTAMGETFRPDMVEEAGAEDVLFKPITPSRIARVAQELRAAHEPTT